MWRHFQLLCMLAPKFGPQRWPTENILPYFTKRKVLKIITFLPNHITFSCEKCCEENHFPSWQHLEKSLSFHEEEKADIPVSWLADIFGYSKFTHLPGNIQKKKNLVAHTNCHVIIKCCTPTHFLTFFLHPLFLLLYIPG